MQVFLSLPALYILYDMRDIKTVTIGQFICSELDLRQVGHIYGVPGDAITGIRKALNSFEKIQNVMCAHESTAAFSAEIYGRIKKLSALYLTYTVGVNNALNGIDEGYIHNSAMVVIGGEPSIGFRETDPCLHHHQLRRGDFDDQLKFLALKLGVERVKSITDLATAAKDIAILVGKAEKDRLPIYLGIPADSWDKEISYDEDEIEKIRSQYNSNRAEPESFDTDAVLEILEQTIAVMKHPLISVGHAVREFNLLSETVALAEKCNVPVVARFNGHGTFPPDHPLFIGTYNGPASVPGQIREFTENSERIDIGVLDTDLNFALQTKTVKLPRAAMVFDPREGFISVGTSFLVHCNARTQAHVLKRLAQTAKRHETRDAIPFPTLVHERDIAWGKKNKEGVIAVSDIAPIVTRFLRDKNIPVVSDVGDPMLVMLDILPGSGSKIMYTSNFASMGVFAGCIGLGHATGKRPLVLVGDGAFCMGETYSLAITGACPVIIIFNNGGWRMMRKFGGENKETEKKKGYDSLIWPPADFHADFIVHTPQEFEKALEDAFQKNAPAIIDLRLDPDDESESLKNFKDAKNNS